MRVSIALICLFICTTAHAANPPAWWQHAEKQARENGYALITDKQLTALLECETPGEDFLLIDARPDYEFNAGHLPGSVSFEFDLSDTTDPSPERLARFEQLAGPDRSRPIVIYCRSMR